MKKLVESAKKLYEADSNLRMAIQVVKLAILRLVIRTDEHTKEDNNG